MDNIRSILYETYVLTLEYLFEAEELEDALIDGWMETKTTFVRSEGAAMMMVTCIMCVFACERSKGGGCKKEKVDRI